MKTWPQKVLSSVHTPGDHGYLWIYTLGGQSQRMGSPSLHLITRQAMVENSMENEAPGSYTLVSCICSNKVVWHILQEGELM